MVAARLSEDSNRTVLVLEAGDAHLDDPDILTPGKVCTSLPDIRIFLYLFTGVERPW